jgi:chemotaxis protein MotB
MSRKRKAPEDEGGYSWMDTYGDLVTLLLCFFVLLYSFSTIDATKWQELVGAFSGSRAMEVELLDAQAIRQNEVMIEGVEKTDGQDKDSKDTVDTESGNVVEDEYAEDFDALYQAIKTYIYENELETKIMASKDDDVILVRFLEVVLFNSGEAVILPEGRAVLDHVITIIGENVEAVQMVRIEGHTDNVPIHTLQFESNWELSMERANAALWCFIDSGVIDLEKLSAAAYGEYHPVDTNETTEGRASNRRVDFVIEKTKPDNNG